MKRNRRLRPLVLSLFSLIVPLILTAVLASVGSAHFKEIPGAQDLQSHNDFAEPDMVCKLRPDGIGTNNVSANLGDGQNVGFLGQIGGSVSGVPFKSAEWQLRTFLGKRCVRKVIRCLGWGRLRTRNRLGSCLAVPAESGTAITANDP